MILVDVNLFLYAEDSLSEHHEKARNCWDGQLSRTDLVGLCWPVIKGFIRIGTNPRIVQRPLTLKEACQRVNSWLEQPCVRLIQPTGQHRAVFEKFLHAGNAVGKLVSDAHLAAPAVEHNCVLQSTDQDFARFSGLKWKNPIEVR